MKRVTINFTAGRRIHVYPQGGSQLEYYVEGAGWVVDDRHDVNFIDKLDEAIDLLKRVREKIYLCS